MNFRTNSRKSTGVRSRIRELASSAALVLLGIIAFGSLAVANEPTVGSTEAVSSDGFYSITGTPPSTGTIYIRSAELHELRYGPTVSGESVVRAGYNTDPVVYSAENKAPGSYTYRFEVSWDYGVIGSSNRMSAFTTVEVVDSEAQAATVSGLDAYKKYDIYYGDFNNDGRDGDIYFHGRDLFVPIGIDILVPLFLDGPKGFVFFRTRGGYTRSFPSDLDKAALVGHSVAKEGIDYFFGSLNGDDSPDLLIRGKNKSDPGLTVFSGLEPEMPQSAVLKFNQHSNSSLNFDISDRSVSIKFIDRDGDRQADIVRVGTAPAPDQVYYSATSIGSSTASFDTFAPALFFPETIVGGTEGDLSVSPTGKLNYIYPIFVPDGINGTQPDLNFSYSSGERNGVMGVGWSLTGASAIDRCKQNHLYDGKTAPITWGASDRFCIDGKRLILVQGAVYGAPGSEYKTEVDSFSVFRAVGGSTGRPDYFEVDMKNGGSRRYGYTENSRYRTGDGDHVMTWAMSEHKSSAGNLISYEYRTDSSDFHLEALNYANGTVRLEFKYSYSRKDHRSRNVGGYTFINRSRLDRVEVIDGGQLVRSYDLVYGEDKGTSLVRTALQSIVECAQRKCFKPTEFEWQKAELVESAHPGEGDMLAQSGSYNASSVTFADADGDGMKDALVNRDGIYAVSRFNPESSAYGVSYQAADTENVFSRGLRVSDVNLDGIDDVVYSTYSPEGEGVFIRYGQGIGAVEAGAALSDQALPLCEGYFMDFVDVNGDGIQDAVFLGTQKYNDYRLDLDPQGFARSSYLLVRLGLKQQEDFFRIGFSSCRRIHLPSVNGLSSAVYDINWRGQMPWMFGSQTTLAWGGFAVGHAGGMAGPRSHVWGDFNGDGAQDLLVRNGDKAVLLTLDVNSSTAAVIGSPFAMDPDTVFYLHESGTQTANTQQFFAKDINGDGCDDLIKLKYTSYHEEIAHYYPFYRMSCGANEAFLPMLPALRNPLGGSLQSVDIDYDGRAEFIFDNRNGYRIGTAEGVMVGKGAIAWNGNRFVARRLPEHLNSLELGDRFFTDIDGDGIIDDTGLEMTDLFGGRVRRTSRRHVSNGSGHGALISGVLSSRGKNMRIDYSHRKFSSVYAQQEQAGYLNESMCYAEFDDAGGEACRIVYDAKIETLEDYYNDLKFGGDYHKPIAGRLAQDSLNQNIDQAMTVVSRVTERRMSAGATPGTSQLARDFIQEYYYKNPRFQALRGFLGFESVAKVDRSTNTVVQNVYRQDFPFVGKPLFTQVRHIDDEANRSAVLMSTYFDWRLTGDGFLNPTYPYQPYVKTQVSSSHDPDTGRLLKQEKLHKVVVDLFGNAEQEMHEIIGASGERKTVSIQRDFIGPDWQRARGLADVLTETTTLYTASGADSHTSVEAYTYHQGGAAKGKLRTAAVEPHKAAYSSTKTYTYDETTGALTGTILSAAGLEPRSERVVYDASGRFVERKYDTYDRLIEEVLEWSELGQPERVAGVNGREEKYVYDEIGRIIEQSSNTGARTSTRYRWCDASISCPSGAILRVSEQNGDGSWSRLYKNELGRVVRQQEVAFDGGAINVDVHYDVAGRERFQSLPYFDSGLAQHWIEKRYDQIGRLIRTVKPGGEIITASYTGFEKTTTNGLLQDTKVVTNAFGEVIEARDQDGAEIKYEYNAQGLLRFVTSLGSEADPHNIVIETNYDHLGRKNYLKDPDQGEWIYHYNAYGDMEYQRNALMHSQTNTYDRMGRISTRTDNKLAGSVEAFTRWFYDDVDANGDVVANAIGSLTGVLQAGEAGVATCSSVGVTYCENMRYDNLGRIHKSTKDLGANGVYSSYIYYDHLGRVSEERDALNDVIGGSGIVHHYNPFGFGAELSDVRSGDVLYKVLAMDQLGNATDIDVANAVIRRDFEYNQQTGRIAHQSASSLLDVQAINYQWDKVGNLKYRHNTRYNGQVLEESFCYDTINRLVFTKVDGGPSFDCGVPQLSDHDVTYNSIGNITFKAGVGSYSYTGSGGPHAVSKAGDISYFYDANGNLNADGSGRNLDYTSFNKPHTIKKGSGISTMFEYGPDRARWKRTEQRAGEATKVVLYLGPVEKEVVLGSSSSKWRRYLGDSAIFSMETDQAGNVLGVVEKKYIFKDALGSTDVITNEYGEVENAARDAMGFDAWGQRRNAFNGMQLSATALSDFDTTVTSRGFTGHEMLDKTGLIHMGGRVYDPKLSRFVSADPLIQAPHNTQSYNRYSYVMNRPLTLVDPSGFESSPIGGMPTIDYSGINSLADSVLGSSTNLGNPPALTIGVASIDTVSNTIIVTETGIGNVSVNYDDAQQTGQQYLQQNGYGLQAAINRANDPAFVMHMARYMVLRTAIQTETNVLYKRLMSNPSVLGSFMGHQNSKLDDLDRQFASGQGLLPLGNVTPILDIAGFGLIRGGVKGIGLRLMRGGGETSLVTKGLAGLSRSQTKTALQTAQEAYKGTTKIGHSLSKHAGRNSDTWGKVTGSQKSWNGQAMKHMREIFRGPGEFSKLTNDKGITFLEKRLSDGRGLRLNQDYTFKGFID